MLDEGQASGPEAEMRISRISAYAVSLPLVDRVYAWSRDHQVRSYDTTVVRVDTDEGMTGWGEVCPLGPFYLPAYARGVLSGLAELAPHLLGADPRELLAINATMDRSLKGHPYVKSPLDVACWDLLGKSAGLPVSTLLGGRFGDHVSVYHSVSQDTPEAMVDTTQRVRERHGITAWQLKVGGADEVKDVARIRAVAEAVPGELVIADGNTGWLTHQARRVVRAVRDLDVVVEQPCASYEECMVVRRATDLRFVLDESIDGVVPLARAHADGAMDVVNVKIGKVGGLTRARQMRDLCLALGLAVTVEDMPGADITGATILHLAHSTPESHRFAVTSSYLKVEGHLAHGGPVVTDGRTAANTAPGLGVEPDLEVLGDPVLAVGPSV